MSAKRKEREGERGKERESDMWNGSHPPDRIIVGSVCTRTHVTRVQGRHKWVGALERGR